VGTPTNSSFPSSLQTPDSNNLKGFPKSFKDNDFKNQSMNQQLKVK
jgi:hypothetical protein